MEIHPGAALIHVDRKTDRRIDGWMDGWMDRHDEANKHFS
jgi:hypothetical protein